MIEAIIIGGGLSGLSCCKSLNKKNYNHLLLEKNQSIQKPNSWKTFTSVTEKYQLEDCVLSTPEIIKFRAINNSNIEYTANVPISCAVMDSKKVYNHFLSYIDLSTIKTNSEVTGIKKLKEGYEVLTKNESFLTKKIIDASGPISVVDKHLGKTEEIPNMFYTCYGKRFTNVDTTELKEYAFFDFESPFRLAGSWVYCLDENTADLGVARFSNEFELNLPLKTERIPELEGVLNYYKNKIEPFNKSFENSKIIDNFSGVTPLCSRLTISRNKNTIFYIGDNQGSVPYSGYGFEHCIQSGIEAANSAIKNKEYKFRITQPSIGLAILRHLSSCTPYELRTTSTGISDLQAHEIEQFFRGNTNLKFLKRAYEVSRKRNINILKNNPLDLVARGLIGLKPKIKHYDLFNKPVTKEQRFE